VNHELHEETTRGRRHAGGKHRSRMGHWLMMFACCVPMFLIVGVLYFTGVVGFGFIVAAVVCIAMMPLMHGSMFHGGAGEDDPGDPGQ